MLLRFVSAALLACVGTSGALAQRAASDPAGQDLGSVVLRAKGGGFDFSGQLKSFDGNIYVLESAMGTLSLEAAQFDCVGVACKGPGQVAGAGGAAPAGPESFAIHGSTTIGARLMPELVQSYARTLEGQSERIAGDKPNEETIRLVNAAGTELAAIELHRYGSSTAFPALAAGDVAIGMADRPITPDERARHVAASATRTPPQEFVLGLDAVAVIVPQSRELAGVTTEELARIFSGQITDWSALGQPPGRITVLAPDSGQGTFSIFARTVLLPAKLTMSPYATRMDGNAPMSEAVARDPNAIGIVSFATVGNAKVVAVKGACGLTPAPSSFNIKTDEYPFSRRLQLFTSGPLTQPVAKGLLAFALSKEGQAIVAQQNFVDLAIESQPFAAHADRFAALAQPAAAEAVAVRQLLADVGSARRLSVTFRFLSGSSVFDPKARQDAVRLAELLRTPEYRGKTVQFLGFTDIVGNPQANTLLGLRRAGQVRVAVLAAAAGQIPPAQLVARGHGPLAPVACNDTADNQQLNRRVEVWVRD